MPEHLTRQQIAAAERRAERIAGIESDLAIGIEPARIAADLGIQRDSLGRYLDRAGRHDLASRFYLTSRPKNGYSRGYTCIDCGGRRHNQSRQRCFTCEIAARRRAA